MTPEQFFGWRLPIAALLASDRKDKWLSSLEVLVGWHHPRYSWAAGRLLGQVACGPTALEPVMSHR